MLIKIDNTVASLLSEDRADLVIQLTRSNRMYAWHEGEVIGKTIDNFALANPKATFGDFIAWTKKTYMARLRAHTEGEKFDSYSLTGDYNPTQSTDPGQGEFAKHGVTAINDAAPSRPKPRTDLRKVAEPGDEEQVDQADAAALALELPPIEPGQKPDEPDHAPAPTTVPKVDPLDKFRNANK